MDEMMRERPIPEKPEDMMILSRDSNRQFVLSYAESGRIIQVDEHTASKLMLLESLEETDKIRRLVSQFMGTEAKGFRLDAVLMAEVEAKEQKGKDNSASEMMIDADVNRGKGKNHPIETEEGRRRRESENEQSAEKGESRNSVLDAHITGIGAAGDFHLTARVQDENSGKVRELKGMITGLDAALLRSDANEENKDGTVLRNAQALVCENFEKSMSAALTPNHAMTMKMD